GELDLVEERAARERVERLERHRLLARLEPHDRLEKEAVRADGEVLEGGRREGPRGELMIGQRPAGEVVGVDEPVRRGPAPEPAPAAGADGRPVVDLRGG